MLSVSMRIFESYLRALGSPSRVSSGVSVVDPLLGVVDVVVGGELDDGFGGSGLSVMQT